ncbi:60S acidic ribosomal protein P1-like [Sesamum indicum]|uniref:60S acidic ribosomal protein P1-like n=1 Tax=Sesamum indicum TaxID=4182 RepID=A0A6I9T1P4_SESIN|nr:60S acidic ribosomal protein P1-like [Sesamum indicum]
MAILRRSSSEKRSISIYSPVKEKMSFGELACTYAALILHDDGIPITAEKIATLVKAANVTVESYWPSLFAKLCEKRNIDDLVMNVGSGGGGAAIAAAAPAGGASGGAPAAEEKKEEPKEESDDDMGFSLFD